MITRFEIVDRFDLLFDLRRLADRVYDTVRILIRHGTFVQSVGIDGGRKDAFHLLFERGNGETFFGFFSAEKAR